MTRLYITLLSLVSLAVSLSTDGYTLDLDYGNGSTFFSNFDFEVFGGGDDSTTQDPTHGFTWYVNETTARSRGYIRDEDLYIGVDHSSVTTVANKSREAVRLRSREAFTHGLFILDLAHMPGGICGTWPAWWLYAEASSEHASGEIDMIEQANLATSNEMTIYAYRNDDTPATCAISDRNVSMEGTIEGGSSSDGNCIPDDDGVGGCAISDARPGAFGTQFNDNGGGVYATQWDSDGVRIWWWSPPSTMPQDATTGPLGSSPSPSTWGTPSARFHGCDWDRFLGAQHIQLNTAFCGDEAGGAGWGGEDTAEDEGQSDAGASTDETQSCRKKTGVQTCYDYVRANPADFEQAYWQINSLRVYQRQASSDGDGVDDTGDMNTKASAAMVSQVSLSLGFCVLLCTGVLAGV